MWCFPGVATAANTVPAIEVSLSKSDSEVNVGCSAPKSVGYGKICVRLGYKCKDLVTRAANTAYEMEVELSDLSPQPCALPWATRITFYWSYSG
jgi:hypothetical protein